MILENFVAFDVEIANAKRASICQIALVKVSNGTISSVWSSFVQPAPEFQELGIYQHRIHKIDQDSYLEAPTLKELWPTIREFIGEDVLVAHNAAFDVNALKQSLDSWDFDYELPEAICTMRIAQKALPQHQPTLKNLCAILDVQLTDHHNAEFDATACAQVALHLFSMLPNSSLKETIKDFGYGNHQARESHWGSNPSLDIARAEFAEAQWEVLQFFQQNPLKLNFQQFPLSGYRIGLIRSLYSLSDKQTFDWIEALGGEVELVDPQDENVDVVLVGNHPCRDATRKLVDVKRLAALKRAERQMMSAQEFYQLALDALVE
jgi:DNA polymerase III subunit epsilon